MKTRILTIILSLLLIVPIITTTSFAEKVSGTCGENLTWEYDTETKTLTVSGEGDMEDFFLVLYENSGGYGNFAGWKDYRGEIEKLVVEEGVTSIGDNSFSNCVKLTEVSLPQTLTRIGRNAFNDCALLESIDLPDGLTEIGLSAFGNCTSLKEITIPGGVEELPMSAFGGCASLETLNISEGVKSFGRTAFGRCTSLKSVDFPESFEEIGMEAFGWCTALETVNLPDKAVTVHPTAFTETPLYDNMGEGINYIGKVAFRYIEGEPESNIAVPEGTRAIADYCFSECGNIKSVTVPSSVEYLGPYAFDKCPALESINVDDGNENYVSVDGIAYTKDMKTLVRFPQGRKANSLDLPDSIEILGASCLKDSAIKFVRIGDGLQLIKADATAGCDYVLLYCDCRYPAYTLKGDKFKVEINTEPTIIKYDDQGNVTSKTYTQQIMYYYSDIPTVGEDDWDRYGDLIVRTLWNYPCHFNDCQGKKWFSKAAAYCGYLGYMSGFEKLIFSPDTELTRAQMVQILAKVAGADLDTYEPSGGFADVAEDAWYANAVEWAVQNGITSGTGEGKFSPEDPVSREQLAVFLKAMAVMLGYDTSDQADIEGYSDKGDISEWAVDAIRWAVGKGLITGTSETTVSPKLTATRAQTAVIIMMFNR